MFTLKRKAAERQAVAVQDAKARGFDKGFAVALAKGAENGWRGMRSVLLEDIDLDLAALEDELTSIHGKGSGHERAKVAGQIEALRTFRKTVETISS